MTDIDRICILVSENDVLIRNLISTIVSNDGYLVLAAADDMEAIELSRSFAGEIRLLIAKSGGLAEAITTERPETRTVMLSPSTLSALKEIVRRVHPGAFRHQAALPQELSDSIRRALRDSGAGGAT